MLNFHLPVQVGVWITLVFEGRYIEFYSLNFILPQSIIAPSVPSIRSSNILIQLVLESFYSSIELFIITIQQMLHLCSHHVQ